MPAKSEPVPFLLFGDNQEQRIVGVHADMSGGAPTVTVYRRELTDRVTARTDRVFPFAFFSRLSDLEALPRDSLQIQVLDGELEYRYLVVFDSWSLYYEATESRRASVDLGYPSFYRPGTPVQQYLLQSGRTCFKGMSFDDLHRMQLDIEVRSDGGFPRARRPSDEIIIVALSDNRGWSVILDSRAGGEAALLRRMVATIYERDPDVIEGHNIFRFDLPYIEARCKLHDVPLLIGRGRVVPRTFETSMRFAERAFEFTSYEIAGRHVVDTFLLLMSYDVSRRRLSGYGLKEAARHFGFASPERTYIPGDMITNVWETEPDLLVKYARDDVEETAALARLLSGASFYLTQMTPMLYQDVARSGPGVKIESLMVRSYLRQRHSLPAPRPIGTVSGAYTAVLYTGVAEPVVYADVESLYPSIMLLHDIHPSCDSLSVFQDLLKHLTRLRIETKAAMAGARSDRERQELDARQNSFKILINSFYGYLGYGLALFNDSAEADRTTRIGQEILRTVMSLIVTKGGRIIEVDTDGVFFIPPPDASTELDEFRLIEALNDELPDGIKVTLDGRFAKMLSYKMKNYVLVDYDGEMKFKGSSLVSRSSERFGRRFVRRCVRLILDDDIDGLHREYLDVRRRISGHEWTDALDFARVETIKERLSDYAAAVESGTRLQSAAYEVALELSRRGQRVRKGDRVSYYVARSHKPARLFESARPIGDWNPSSPDEDTRYYLRRLDEFASKFEVFFAPADFRRVFSVEDLFGFSADGIAIRSGEAVATV